MCGFYPESLTKTNRSKMGLNAYINYGRTSYNYAVSVGNKIKNQKTDIQGVSNASVNFKSLARAIFNFRNRINSGEFIIIKPEAIREIREVIYDGKPIVQFSEKGLLRSV